MANRTQTERVTVPARFAGRRPPQALRTAYPTLALVTILGIDALIGSRRWSVPALGALDDTAHLLTAGLILAAIGLHRIGRMLPWALLGSVIIDLDHLPLYTFAPDFVAGGRPPTHSLVTPAILLMVAALVPRLRWVAGGLALGVCLHFVRDIATGPGVALLWPLHGTAVRIDYRWYLGIVVVTALAATWRTASTVMKASAGEGARQTGTAG